MLPVRYEHHLHIKEYGYPCIRPWRSIDMLPVNYENHLHIENKADTA
jgi:hypothetical protein